MLLVGNSSTYCGTNDVLNSESSHLSGIYGSLALIISEEGRNGYHSIEDLLVKICFGLILHFLKNHSRDFLRIVFFALSLEVNHDHWI